MRTREEVSLVQRLITDGLNDCEIERQTGISRVRRIFCDACDQLNIPWRQSNPRNISIARREGVQMLDSFIGPKS